MSNPTARPNFLVFIVDQMSSFSLGHLGNPEVQTPNIDRLAKQGVSFSRAYCSNPVCSPSRATLHTGLTPRQHGLITNGCHLSPQVPTLPQALVNAGYRTHCVGKIHLQPFSNGERQPNGEPVTWESRDLWNEGVIESLPLPYYGYQSVDYVGGHVHYVNGDYVNDIEARHPGTKAQLSQAESYYHVPDSQTWRMPVEPERHYNHWIADKSLAFLDNVNAEENFFLVASFPDPHHPFAACRPYSEMFDPAQITLPPTWQEDDDLCDFLARHEQSTWRNWDETILRESIAQTYGMIAHIDENIGRILDGLTAQGLADNTVVVFLADHGEYLGAHHLLLKGPWPYEPVVRVPYIWADPTSAGQPPRNEVVSLLDFVPTILDYAGIAQTEFDMRRDTISDLPGLPGRSLRRAISQAETLNDTGVLVEFDEDYRPGQMCRYRMLIDSRYKLCLYGGTGQGILIDLAQDPHERQNLWANATYTELKGTMLATLADRLAWTDRLDTVRVCSA